MTEADRTKYLRLALLLVGLIFIVGIYPLTIIWPSGWSWHTTGQSEYLQMILGIYATLDVFLVIASRNPLAHRSLIWFGTVITKLDAVMNELQAHREEDVFGAAQLGRHDDRIEDHERRLKTLEASPVTVI